jgi:hypothetical protein
VFLERRWLGDFDAFWGSAARDPVPTMPKFFSASPLKPWNIWNMMILKAFRAFLMEHLGTSRT